MALKKGNIVDIHIERAAYEGKGIGKIDSKAVFVKNTAPGDKVKIRITKKRRNYLSGTLLEIIEPGPTRQKPFCSHADICGGCTWQHVHYEEQLRFKREHVRDHIQRIGGLKETEPLPTIGSERQIHYRNKMEYTFGNRRWLTREEIDSGIAFNDLDIAVGMHIPGRFDRILNLTECYLQEPVSYEIMNFVREYALKHEIPAYNPIKKEGFFRNVMIRNSYHTGDLMVNLVTFEDRPETMHQLAEKLMAEFPDITTVVNNVNDTWSPSSEGRFEHILAGPGYITEHIGGYSFRISANTFFQTNTLQAEKLYEIAKEFADLKPDDTVFDLYCGVGSLTLYVCDNVNKVVGIELNPVSVQKAEENAERNSVTNCYFETGDMKDVFTDTFVAKYGNPDVIITDPPRAGMHPDVIKTICRLAPERLVYVSCNSTTLARDLADLSAVYEIHRIQPVDMFPHTYHIETVAELRRKQ
jgi:23S rRNA (uracil1939-C5)-methyltransferase